MGTISLIKCWAGCNILEGGARHTVGMFKRNASRCHPHGPCHKDTQRGPSSGDQTPQFFPTSN